METENILENKAKFFAQYWGCKVCNYYDNLFIYDFTFPKHWVKHTFLELKPLSSITDEVLLEVAKILLRQKEDLDVYKIISEDNSHWITHCSRTMTTFLSWNDFFWREVSGCPCVEMTYTAIDYLRSKGYALPYMGLSVEDLVSYGWVKLKTNNGLTDNI